MRNLYHRFDSYYIGQIYGGDFAKICGLLRIYELYLLNYFLDTRHTPVGCLQNSYAETRHHRSLDLLYHPDCSQWKNELGTVGHLLLNLANIPYIKYKSHNLSKGLITKRYFNWNVLYKTIIKFFTTFSNLKINK